MKNYLKINALIILFHSIFMFITGMMALNNPTFEVAIFSNKFFMLILFYVTVTLLEAIGLFFYNIAAIIAAPFVCLYFIYCYIQALMTGTLNLLPFNTLFSINYLALLIFSTIIIKQKYFKKI